jgi:serine protease Do
MLRRIATQHAGGTLMVVRHNGDDGVEFLGSGFLCHRKGAVLTSAHNLNPMDKIAVTPGQPINEFSRRTLDRVHTIEMQISQFDPVNDVALLMPKQADLPCNVPSNIFCNAEDLPVGASVAYIGFPYASKGLHTTKISQSIICGKSLSESGTCQLHIDANVHEGNSGGPVIDVSSGQVVGIVSGRFSPTGSDGNIMIGDFALGTESTISFVSTISYGIALMKAEGLDV